VVKIVLFYTNLSTNHCSEKSNIRFGFFSNKIKMRKNILYFLCFLCLVFSTKAQTLRQFIVEETQGEGLFTQSCNSPAMGVLVFKSAIVGLHFELNLPTRLINVNYNRQRNEYVLCVQPTDRQYWVTIAGQGYESVDFEVKNIQQGIAQFFRINPKETGSNSTTTTITPHIDVYELPRRDPIRFLKTRKPKASSQCLTATTCQVGMIIGAIFLVMESFFTIRRVGAMATSIPKRNIQISSCVLSSC